MRLFRAVLFFLALLSPGAFSGLSIHDTLVAGVPWLSIEHQGKSSKSSKPDRSGLKIDRDRGVPRASLTLPDGSRWTFWNQSPFVRQGRGLASLVLPARISTTSLVVPVDGSLGRKLRALRKAQAPPADAPVLLAEQAPTPSAAPSPEPSSADSQPADSETASSAPDPETSEDASAEPLPAPPPQPSTGAKGVFTVVLDAGHGGKDPGAVGKKVGGKPLLEKDATLAIAKMVRDELRGHKGIRVVLTRDQDEFLSLGERTRIANKEKGELFVSIHCNSLPTASKRRDEVQGFMIYLLREAKSEADRAIERRENEAIRFETGERQRKEALSPLEWVMLEHQLNLFTKESERFAEIVVKNMESKGPVKKERTGAGQAGFFVLVGALMPSVLIETGYVSNDADARNLGSVSGRKAIARQIARSIQEFQRSRP